MRGNEAKIGKEVRDKLVRNRSVRRNRKCVNTEEIGEKKRFRE